jgi:CrcB protein
VSLLAVASGGALGAVARYLASGWVQDWTGSFFPWGTFAVNVAGCVLLGFSMTWMQTSFSSTEARELITVGLLASFTTFSTFSYEAIAMVRDGELLRAGGYVLGSVMLGLAGVVAGSALAGSLLRARG